MTSKSISLHCKSLIKNNIQQTVPIWVTYNNSLYIYFIVHHIFTKNNQKVTH